jgi:hypothetical protein
MSSPNTKKIDQLFEEYSLIKNQASKSLFSMLQYTTTLCVFQYAN